MKKYHIRAESNKTSRFIKAENGQNAMSIWFKLMEKEGYELEYGEYFSLREC